MGFFLHEQTQNMPENQKNASPRAPSQSYSFISDILDGKVPVENNENVSDDKYGSPSDDPLDIDVLGTFDTASLLAPEIDTDGTVDLANIGDRREQAGPLSPDLDVIAEAKAPELHSDFCRELQTAAAEKQTPTESWEAEQNSTSNSGNRDRQARKAIETTSAGTWQTLCDTVTRQGGTAKRKKRAGPAASAVNEDNADGSTVLKDGQGQSEAQGNGSPRIHKVFIQPVRGVSSLSAKENQSGPGINAKQSQDCTTDTAVDEVRKPLHTTTWEPPLRKRSGIPVQIQNPKALERDGDKSLQTPKKSNSPHLAHEATTYATKAAVHEPHRVTIPRPPSSKRNVDSAENANLAALERRGAHCAQQTPVSNEHQLAHNISKFTQSQGLPSLPRELVAQVLVAAGHGNVQSAALNSRTNGQDLGSATGVTEGRQASDLAKQLFSAFVAQLAATQKIAQPAVAELACPSPKQVRAHEPSRKDLAVSGAGSQTHKRLKAGSSRGDCKSKPKAIPEVETTVPDHGAGPDSEKPRTEQMVARLPLPPTKLPTTEGSEAALLPELGHGQGAPVKEGIKAPKRKRTRVEDLDPTQVHICSFEDCRKKFAKKYNLKIHERRHRGDLPFICGQCGKKFMWHSSFVRHLKVHEARAEGSGKKLRKGKGTSKSMHYQITRLSETKSSLTMNGLEMTVDHLTQESVALAVSLCTMNSVPYEELLVNVNDEGEDQERIPPAAESVDPMVDIEQFLVVDESEGAMPDQ